MSEVARWKGQYLQAGMVIPVVQVSGSTVSHDGTLGLDEVYLQADYPVLFDLIGTTFNDTDKGDDAATQFRTPPGDGLPALTGFEWRIRF